MDEISKALGVIGAVAGIIFIIFAIPTFGIGTVLMCLAIATVVGFIGTKIGHFLASILALVVFILIVSII